MLKIIRLVLKELTVTNTIAYYNTEAFIVVKVLYHKPGGLYYKSLMAVIVTVL